MTPTRMVLLQGSRPRTLPERGRILRTDRRATPGPDTPRGAPAVAIEIGCSTILFNTNTFDEAIEPIAEAGFRLVDLCAVPGFAPHLDVDGDAKEQGGYARKRLEQLGLTPTGINCVAWIPNLWG